MPAITMEMTKLTKEQRAELVKDFTESAARVTGIPKDAFYVFIKENEADHVGVGGILLSEQK